jgi:OOP family OmpA-OmpF porin
MNCRRRLASLAGVLAVVAQIAISVDAHAQSAAVDLPKFNPSPAGDRFFGVPSAYTAGESDFHAMTLLDYAYNPLVLVADTGQDAGAVVSSQMLLHVGLNFAIIDRISVNADMPFALLSSGDDLTGGAAAFPAPAGASLGDLRLGARGTLLGGYHDPFQLAVGGYLWVPTGGSDSFVSDGSVRGQPQIVVGGEAQEFIYSVMLGPSFRGATTVGDTTLGHQFNWGLGAGVQLLQGRTLQLHVESTGAIDIQNPAGRATNAELQVGAKYRFLDFLEVGAGVGPGLTTGVGTPAVRGLFQFAYTPNVDTKPTDRDGDTIVDEIDACPDTPGVADPDPAKHGCPKAKDFDKDGIFDSEDACPEEAGDKSDDPKKNGCPRRDKDRDGVLDDDDACPEIPGEKSDDPEKNGCPRNDRDADGVLDDVDMCPEIPGVRSDDPKKNGCPPDTDGDGFRDDQDACPREKGKDDPDPSKRGCPKLVRVTESEILILEQVQFDTNKASIKPVSGPLLDSVAQVLKEHPEILKLEVQGHTDNKGSAGLNEKLSDGRAKAVRDALVKRGVEASRLTAVGYGPNKPVDDNNTDAGRAKNRRVQFVVLEKQPGASK